MEAGRLKARNLMLQRGMDGKVTMLVELDRDSVSQAQSLFDELNSKDLSVSLSAYREKRSLNANSYFWLLVGQLAAKIGVPKEKIYREYIKEIGDNYDIVCVQENAAESLCNGWEHNGVGWQTELLTSKISGCVNVILYYGSSTYNTEQMSRLLEMLIADCEENGVPTETPEQIALMEERWKD